MSGDEKYDKVCEPVTYIRFDWAMKHMLRDKANFEILEGLISVLTGEEVKIEEILESESNQNDKNDKFNRVDIKAKNTKGHIILVEIQLSSQYEFLQRLLYATSKTITEHIELGNKYDKVKKVYSISILYCDFGEGDDYLYHGFTHFKGVHTGTDLVVTAKENNILVHDTADRVFPEYYIIRVNEYDKIPENPLEEWLTYLKTGKVREDTTAPGLQQVRKKLRYLSMSQKDRKAYEAHIDNILVQNDAIEVATDKGIAIGMKMGMEMGMEMGIAQEAHRKDVQFARSSLAKGLDPGLVAELTGLSLDEVNSIRSEMNP